MNVIKRATRAVLAAGIVILGLGAMEKAHAILNGQDTMTVSVTPNVNYGITISSVNSAGYQFGPVALGATTVSTSAITLTNPGNVAEYFSMAISNSTGSWNATSGAASTDTFRMIAELGAGQPDQTAGFAVGDALANPPVPANAANLYHNGAAQAKTIAGSNSKLWLRLEMPTTLNSGLATPENFQLTVNGQGT